MPVLQSTSLQTPRPRAVEAVGIRQSKRRPVHHVGHRQVYLLTRQLATLLRAGMALTPALLALQEQLREAGPGGRQTTMQMAGLVGQIRDRVNGGSSFSAALAQYPEVFSPVYISMVGAGEVGGTLEPTLYRLARMLEKRMRLAGKVKAALAYPVMMAVVAMGVVLFLLAYVVPSLSQVFAEINRPLPWPTVLLIRTSVFLRANLGLILAAQLGLILTAAAALKTYRPWFDRVILKAPLIRGLMLKIETARLARTMGTLLSGGVPLLKAMQISGGILQNGVLRRAWDQIGEAVRHGETLSLSVRRSGLFAPVVCHILATGQQTGTLDQGLLDIAEMYDTEVEDATKTMAAMLEPAILLVMGVLVGFIVMAILLPIFEINQTL